MSTRPLVQMHGVDSAATVALPEVLTAPIRLDVVQFVHTNMNKNARQAVARSRFAGEQTSAESWGTGRAVSRIPRVSGSGTHRSGQGAFGNMCRKGRAFAPLKRWRRWHRHVNKDQRRFAVCSALAASAVAPLVMSRGHKVMQIPEVPLVIADSAFEGITKTSEAVKLLEKIGASDDVARVKASRTIRAGRGAMRNRRYTQRTGPLLIHDGKSNKHSKIAHAFRNISGVQVSSVHSLNLLELAPGGHLGRFIIWTESAFKALDSIFGTSEKESEVKPGYNPPTHQVTNADIGAIINSTDVQSALRAKKRGSVKQGRKVNALKNMSTMAKLNPYFISMRRQAILQARKASKEDRKKKVSKKRGSRSPKYAKLLLAEKARLFTVVTFSSSSTSLPFRSPLPPRHASLLFGRPALTAAALAAAALPDDFADVVGAAGSSVAALLRDFPRFLLTGAASSAAGAALVAPAFDPFFLDDEDLPPFRDEEVVA
eukprot:CAMPEP_0170745726 /NCGR_PEP_ID=MMETSP0437-20130122/8440_1 /TAXON_ID=0 /ORGANISM="Sexangularia sp." /LENGTH=485 /DNA_ID=CAMNT_0011084451 /DNA_START=56 /DNA_END=1512 /DNA_ORIENTATION=+